MGSGKSEILCRVCIELCSRVPGAQGIIGRFTFRDFQRTTRVTMQRVMVPELVERELAGGDGWVLRTTNPDKPSTLWTGHFDNAEAYQSMGLAFFGIDEVNGDGLGASVPESVFHMLDARLGRDHASDIKPYGLLSGNCGGHNWVWRLFHPDSQDRLADAWMFTPRPYENAKHLPLGYYEGLTARNGVEWVARYVEGSHDVFEGQVYPELSEARHCVNPFEIPPSWPRVIALDYGFRHPTCVGFAAVSWDGEIFVYDEHYLAERMVSYHAEQIRKRLSGMKKAREITWVADPSIFSKVERDGRLYSIYDEYADAGLDEWTPGENDISAGRNRVKQLLATGKLKFVRGCVPNIWREMQGLHWKRLRSLQDRDAPEQEADIDNHGPDMLRYLVMSRPEAAVRDKPKVTDTHRDRQVKFARQHIRAAIARHQREVRGDDEDGDYV